MVVVYWATVVVNNGVTNGGCFFWCLDPIWNKRSRVIKLETLVDLCCYGVAFSFTRPKSPRLFGTFGKNDLTKKEKDQSKHGADDESSGPKTNLKRNHDNNPSGVP